MEALVRSEKTNELLFSYLGNAILCDAENEALQPFGVTAGN